MEAQLSLLLLGPERAPERAPEPGSEPHHERSLPLHAPSGERMGDPERGAWPARPLIVGVDEAGRGPWAGPVVAAAVVFPPWDTPPLDLATLNDSKQLSHEARASLIAPIARHALAIGVARASAAEIDALNILRATHLAMRGAVRRALARLARSPRAPHAPPPSCSSTATARSPPPALPRSRAR